VKTLSTIDWTDPLPFNEPLDEAKFAARLKRSRAKTAKKLAAERLLPDWPKVRLERLRRDRKEAAAWRKAGPDFARVVDNIEQRIAWLKAAK
jgi:hypothetical protein